jgi:hypothetical protein
VHDDMELMAAIGRMVVNAAELEYAVAELAATAEGLRGEECPERATAIVRRTGEAMRQFERLVSQERPDLGWLMRDTAGLLGRGTSSRTLCRSRTPSRKAIPPCLAVPAPGRDHDHYQAGPQQRPDDQGRHRPDPRGDRHLARRPGWGTADR